MDHSILSVPVLFLTVRIAMRAYEAIKKEVCLTAVPFPLLKITIHTRFSIHHGLAPCMLSEVSPVHLQVQADSRRTPY